ncbi:MAG: hypothetical protein IJ110_01525 [Lachnospiraceae bacterium]|nr:hypothetical protein [Lachnospiraceae bacterium]
MDKEMEISISMRRHTQLLNDSAFLHQIGDVVSSNAEDAVALAEVRDIIRDAATMREVLRR